MTKSESPSFICCSFWPINENKKKIYRNCSELSTWQRSRKSMSMLSSYHCVSESMYTCPYLFTFLCVFLSWKCYFETQHLWSRWQHIAIKCPQYSNSTRIDAHWICPRLPESTFTCPQSFQRTGRTRARQFWRAWPLTSVTWAWPWSTSPKERTYQLLQWRGLLSWWEMYSHEQSRTGSGIKLIFLCSLTAYYQKRLYNFH